MLFFGIVYISSRGSLLTPGRAVHLGGSEPMSLASLDTFHVLAALAALLTVAHLGGLVASWFGLPPMLGELAGGVLLGATVLEHAWPAGFTWLFPRVPESGAVPAVLPILGFCGQLGLLLLMFSGGVGMRRLVARSDVRAVSWISGLGVLVPVVVGIVIFRFADFDAYLGPARSHPAFEIVLIAALAVTSIPVITRIFIDLGLMETRLARIVLSVAVLEDVLLYIGLSLAVGMAHGNASADVSIPSQLGMDPGGVAYVAWHVAASLLLLVAASLSVKVLPSRSGSGRDRNPISRRSPLGWTVAFLCGVTLVAMLLGLAPIFGALVAGIAVANDDRPQFLQARQQIETFAMATFVPVYFALVGVSLDLVDNFDVWFSLGLLVVGTVVKFTATLVGARVSGEPPAMARALAISVNARGGPGIVLATVALGAGIIDGPAFTALIILALATSLFAGSWLAWMLRTDPESASQIRGDHTLDAARPHLENRP
jgi:Kef-type K+ transport system membrane component KefB